MALSVLLLAAAPIGTQNVPAYRQADQVAVIVIEGPIDSMTVQSVRRRLQDAMDGGADAIVLRINTPGGELLSTLELCRMLKVDAPANTTAWIDPHAFSAGTIIALACRNIVIARHLAFARRCHAQSAATLLRAALPALSPLVGPRDAPSPAPCRLYCSYWGIEN